jgi:hypothetical protein
MHHVHALARIQVGMCDLTHGCSALLILEQQISRSNRKKFQRVEHICQPFLELVFHRWHRSQLSDNAVRDTCRSAEPPIRSLLRLLTINRHDISWTTSVLELYHLLSHLR